MDDNYTPVPPVETKNGALGVSIIAAEVSVQNEKWGEDHTNSPAYANRQLIGAAIAQAYALSLKTSAEGPDANLDSGSTYFSDDAAYWPRDWQGMRDYGSDIANLAVAGAWIAQEIGRLAALGQSQYRRPRGTEEPYTGKYQPANQVSDTDVRPHVAADDGMPVADQDDS